MSAVYSAADYNFLTDTVMLLLLASFVVLAVFVFRQALQRTPIAKKYVLVLFIHIAIFLVAILWVTPLYRYTNNILPLNEPFFQERAGQVQQVKRLGKLPYHYVDGEFRYGMLLTIDGAEYYMLEDTRITSGVYLLFSAEVEDNLIISWESISREQAEAFVPQPLPPPKKSPAPAPVPAAIAQVGRILTFLGLVVLGLLLLANDRLYIKKVFWLNQKDSRHRNGIVPNFSMLWELLMTFSGILLLVLGSSMQANTYSGLFLLALGGGVMTFLCWLEMQVRVKIIGRYLIITSLGRKEQKSLDSVTRVYFDTRRIKNSARILVITFSDRKELKLPQEHHWGLDDLYNRLRQSCPQISE